MPFNFVREDFNVSAYDAALLSGNADDLRALISVDIGGVFYRYVVDNRDITANGRAYVSNPFINFDGGLSRSAGGQADKLSAVFDIGALMESSGHTGLMADLTQENLSGAPVQVLLASMAGGDAVAAKLKFAGRIERAPMNYQTQTMKIDVLSYVRLARNNTPLTSVPKGHKDRFGVNDKSLDAAAGLTARELIWNGQRA